MQTSTPAMSIPFAPAMRPLRLLLGAVACLILALVNGLALALVETVQTIAAVLRDIFQAARQRLWLEALWLFLRGCFEILSAAPAPLLSNLLVGVGAALELLKQVWDNEDPHFELVVGGGLNMAFSSRTHDVVTHAEVVKIGIRSRYPVIESVEYVDSRFLNTFNDTAVDEDSDTLFSPGLADQRNFEGEYAAASVVDSLKRFATR